MKILVCSAWPYAHGVPHLGNLIGSLLSGDVFSRYYKMKGFDTLYVSGTDMHGTRIEYVAWKNGKKPRELAFETHKKIKQVLNDFDIELDNYSNTESEVHKKFVDEIFKKLYENGYLIKRKEKQAYCKDCKRFLADRLIYGTCPYCGYEHAYGNQCEKCGHLLKPEELINPHCAFCGGTNIIFKETENWYFDLKKLKKDLEEFVKGRNWDEKIKKLSLNMLKNIEPRAVTRDIKWGIPFPMDKDKTIYVWAEAVLGYISSTIEIKKEKEFWFGNVKHIYCIGKDNIPFHTIFFPAELIGSKEDFHLPDKIAYTNYLNWIGNQKFSKSKGIGIFSDEAKYLMNPQLWRFYLLYSRPETKDVIFSWKELDKVINKIFVENVINFIYRALILGKKFGIGRINDEIKKRVKETKEKVEELFEKTLIGKALQEICSLSEFGNKYIQENEPWKTKDKDVIANANYISKAISIMLYPFVPKISNEILNMYDIKPNWDEIKNEKITIFNVKKIVERVEIKMIEEKYEELKNKNFASIEEFKKLGLKVGEIVDAVKIENSKKLLKLKVNVGEIRQIIAGVGEIYEPKELIDKKVIVATNLKPKKLMGITSYGMILGTKEGLIFVEGKPGEELK